MRWTDTNFHGIQEEELGDGSGSGGGTSGEGSAQVSDGSSGAGEGSGGTLLSGEPRKETGEAAAGSGEAIGSTSPNFFTGLWDEHGTINKDNLKFLPEHLKPAEESLARYDTAESLIGAFWNAKQAASKKGIDPEPLPPNAPKEMVEERLELLGKLNGAPQDPAGYKLEKPDDYPENLPWSDERTGKYAEILHKHRASPELARDLLAAQVEDAKEEGTNIQKMVDEKLLDEGNKLRSVFGEEWPQARQMAIRALQTLGWKDGDQPVDENHPAFQNSVTVRLAKMVADLTAEDELLGGAGPGGTGKNAREAALDIVNNKENPYYKAYWDAEDPLHEKAVSEKQRLDALAKRQQGAGV